MGRMNVGLAPDDEEIITKVKEMIEEHEKNFCSCSLGVILLNYLESVGK